MKSERKKNKKTFFLHFGQFNVKLGGSDHLQLEIQWKRCSITDKHTQTDQYQCLSRFQILSYIQLILCKRPINWCHRIKNHFKDGAQNRYRSVHSTTWAQFLSNPLLLLFCCNWTSWNLAVSKKGLLHKIICAADTLNPGSSKHIVCQYSSEIPAVTLDSSLYLYSGVWCSQCVDRKHGS